MPWVYNEVFKTKQTPGKGRFVPATGCGSPNYWAVCDNRTIVPDDPSESWDPVVRLNHEAAMKYLAWENEEHNRKMKGE